MILLPLSAVGPSLASDTMHTRGKSEIDTDLRKDWQGDKMV